MIIKKQNLLEYYKKFVTYNIDEKTILDEYVKKVYDSNSDYVKFIKWFIEVKVNGYLKEKVKTLAEYKVKYSDIDNIDEIDENEFTVYVWFSLSEVLEEFSKLERDRNYIGIRYPLLSPKDIYNGVKFKRIEYLWYLFKNILYDFCEESLNTAGYKYKIYAYDNDIKVVINLD